MVLDTLSESLEGTAVVNALSLTVVTLDGVSVMSAESPYCLSAVSLTCVLNAFSPRMASVCGVPSCGGSLVCSETCGALWAPNSPRHLADLDRRSCLSPFARAFPAGRGRGAGSCFATRRAVLVELSRYIFGQVASVESARLRERGPGLSWGRQHLPGV